MFRNWARKYRKVAGPRFRWLEGVKNRREVNDGEERESVVKEAKVLRVPEEPKSNFTRPMNCLLVMICFGDTQLKEDLSKQSNRVHISLSSETSP
jgi:hypothetical protein